MRGWKMFSATAIALMVVGATAPAATAYPGDPDSTFGDCGLVDSAQAVPNTPQSPQVALSSPDGKVWIVTTDSAGRYGVFRFRPDGTLDPTLNEVGYIVRRALPVQTDVDVTAALAPDGSLIVDVADHYGTKDEAGFIDRILPNGGVDRTFGTDGRYEITGQYPNNRAPVTVLHDGRIIVQLFGQAIRLTTHGVLDTTWGVNGVTQTEGLYFEQADGAIVYFASGDPWIHRLTSNGLADATFGTNGQMFTPLSSNRGGAQFDSHGRLVIVGSARPLQVFRMLPDGSPDTTFGGDGLVTLPMITNESEWLLAVDDADRPVLATKVSDGDTENDALVLTRLAATSQSDPGIDVSFGLGGWMYSDNAWAGDQPVGIFANGAHYDVVTGAIARGWQPLLARYRADGASSPSGYVLTGFGSLEPFAGRAADAPPCTYGPSWDGWDIGRGVTSFASGTGGYIVSAWGSLHAFTPYPEMVEMPRLQSAPYWKGWDIVRGVALDPRTEDRGYELSAWGSLHAFVLEGGSTPPRVARSPYWKGWDIARGVVVLSDGSGGYILDGFGGLHPFALVGGATPPPVTAGPYWRGLDVARGVTLLPDDSGGYIVDAYGGLHPFGIAGNPPPSRAAFGPYWSHRTARGVTLFEVPSPAGAPAQLLSTPQAGARVATRKLRG